MRWQRRPLRLMIQLILIVAVITFYVALMKPFHKWNFFIRNSQRDFLRELSRNATPTIKQDENLLRCAAEYLGCFLPTATENRGNGEGVFSLYTCMESCFSKRGDNYAGFRNGTCLCSKTIDTHFARRPFDAAISADASQNCTKEGSTKVYRKTEGCFTGFSSSFLLSQRIGCIHMPQSLNINMNLWKMEEITSEQCILKCESTGNTVALPLLRENLCMCSDLITMFGTAEKMRVAMESCQNNGSELISVYKTFIEGCSPKRFLKRNEGPRTVLTSFWGSGNTWLRHLIEVATGIYTGSIYMDDYLYRAGMLGEKLGALSGRTIMIKDHMVSDPKRVSTAYKSAVLILRNLYDATISEYARLISHNNHTALLDPDIYKSDDFQKDFLKDLPWKWTSHVELVFQRMPHAMVVFYEDLQQNLHRELRRVIKYLPQKLVPQGDELEKRLLCVNLDETGYFKRGSKGIKEDPFSEITREIYDKTIKEMNDILVRRNVTGLPLSYFERWHLKRPRQVDDE